MGEPRESWGIELGGGREIGEREEGGAREET